MIETNEGLANVEQIAAVEGVDVLHVGCNDLLTAMGKPGKFGDPEIVAAIERVIAAAARRTASSPGWAASATWSGSSPSSARACASSPRRPTSAS